MYVQELKKVNLFTRTDDFIKQNKELGYVVNKMERIMGVTFYSEGKSVITSLVVQKIVRNPLQVVEPYYYYIIFRKKWSKDWWRTPELDTREGELGINMNAEIFDDAYKRKDRRDVSALVLATPDGFYYAVFRDLFGMYNKNPIRVARYKDPKTNRDAYGISKELFSDKDPFI